MRKISVEKYRPALSFKTYKKSVLKGILQHFGNWLILPSTPELVPKNGTCHFKAETVQEFGHPIDGPHNYTNTGGCGNCSVLRGWLYDAISEATLA